MYIIKCILYILALIRSIAIVRPLKGERMCPRSYTHGVFLYFLTFLPIFTPGGLFLVFQFIKQLIKRSRCFFFGIWYALSSKATRSVSLAVSSPANQTVAADNDDAARYHAARALGRWLRRINQGDVNWMEGSVWNFGGIYWAAYSEPELTKVCSVAVTTVECSRSSINHLLSFIGAYCSLRRSSKLPEESDA